MFKGIFKKLFGRTRREPVEDTSEIDVIARGVGGSGRYQSGSSQDPGVYDSPQASVMTTDARKKFRGLW